MGSVASLGRWSVRRADLVWQRGQRQSRPDFESHGAPVEFRPGDVVGLADPVTIMPASESRHEVKETCREQDQRDQEWHMPFSHLSYQQREATLARTVAVDQQSHIQCLVDGLPADLTVSQRRRAEQFIRTRARSFSTGEFDIGRTDILKHQIDTGKNPPHYERLRSCLLYTSPSPRD